MTTIPEAADRMAKGLGHDLFGLVADAMAQAARNGRDLAIGTPRTDPLEMLGGKALIVELVELQPGAKPDGGGPWTIFHTSELANPSAPSYPDAGSMTWRKEGS